jgi:hypothetical protein
MHSNFDQRQDQARDPEDRKAHSEDEKREKALDKALADSFPTSDPPSISDPANPTVESEAENSHREILMGLPAGSWAAISLEDHKLVGTGATRDEAEKAARNRGVPNVELVEVPSESDAPFQAA